MEIKDLIGVILDYIEISYLRIHDDKVDLSLLMVYA